MYTDWSLPRPIVCARVHHSIKLGGIAKSRRKEYDLIMISSELDSFRHETRLGSRLEES